MAAVDACIVAMGSTGRIAIHGGDDGLIDEATARLSQLERRWSRFVDDSDVTRLNTAAGENVAVHEDTIDLVERAIEGWRWSEGRFDPTVERAMVRAGYGGAGEPLADRAAQPAPGCADIEVDHLARTIRLPSGVTFDPGGIGKGLAADIVARLLVDSGAGGALVEIGGDLRTMGEPALGLWTIDVESPWATCAPVATFQLPEAGGVATSTPVHRRWRPGPRPGFHIIDPAAGTAIASDIASVTVIAPEAWMAEVASKAAVVAGADEALAVITDLGHDGVVVRCDRTVETTFGWL